ncbi:MAG: hypothetical protein ACLUNV_04980 [Sutterella wadsworthensis]
MLALMYSGGYWGADPAYHSFACVAWATPPPLPRWCGPPSAPFGVALPAVRPASVWCLLADFMQGLVEGMKLMLPANIILVLAWTLSGVCRDLLSDAAVC